MNTCHDFQAHFLDHLYGLLDDADAQALAAHLEGCDACRAALANAERQQQVIAAAARAQFPHVRFDAPALKAEPAAPTLQFTPLPRPRRWGRWAAAASVLLAVGLGLAAGLILHRHARETAQARAEYDRAVRAQNEYARRVEQDRRHSQQDIAEIQEQIRLLEAKWDSEVQQVQREHADRQMQITVTGPKSVQAGAPNVYQIDAVPLRRAPSGKALQMTARIVDPATHRVLGSRALVEGSTRWELPRDLPVKPGSRLALVVTDDGDPAASWVRVLGSAVSPLGPTPFTAALNAASTAPPRVRLSEALQLIGTVYVSHLTTDRPMYRPGEVVRFRSLTLERFALRPAAEKFHLQYRITDARGAEVFKLDGPARVVDAKGKAVRGPDGTAVQGIGVGEFTIPAGAAGGEYTLTLSELQNRFPPERRRFLVNQFQAPRLNKEVEFTRKSYGPGDVAEANCKVARVEGGGVIDEQPVVVTAQVDGQPCAVLDAGALRVRKGKVTVRFRLPEKMERGQGSLSVQFQDGGTHETIVRPVPIVLKKLFVEFFPEGGDLVAGVRNRVYFTARTTLGKPAELQGRLVGPDGKTLAAVRTLNDDHEAGVNQGMGRFEFTPQAGQAYEVKIDTPIGIEGHYRLPEVKADGVVLSIPEGVFTKRIEVSVASRKRERKLLVGAYCRGRLLDHQTVTVNADASRTVKLTPAAGVGGVYRVTVFEERPGAQLVPVAERLVYRRPVERLDLKVKTDKETYGPGDKVKVTVSAKDEKGKAASAVVLLSAVDLGLLKLADEKTARSMPTHFFLTTEVRRAEDLEYADFLVGKHPRAALALDLLLGTQGWRRFAEQQDPGKFRQEQKQDADRLLLAFGNALPEQKNLAEVGVLNVDQAFAPKHEALEQKLGECEAREEAGQRQAAEWAAELRQRIGAASAVVTDAERRQSASQREVGLYAAVLLAVALLVLSVVGIVAGLRRLASERPGAALCFGGGLGSLMLLFVGGLGLAAYLLPSQSAREGAREMARARAEAPGVAGMAQEAAPAPDLAIPKEAAEMAMKEAEKKDGGFGLDNNGFRGDKGKVKDLAGDKVLNLDDQNRIVKAAMDPAVRAPEKRIQFAPEMPPPAPPAVVAPAGTPPVVAAAPAPMPNGAVMFNRPVAPGMGLMGGGMNMMGGMMGGPGMGGQWRPQGGMGMMGLGGFQPAQGQFQQFKFPVQGMPGQPGGGPMMPMAQPGMPMPPRDMAPMADGLRLQLLQAERQLRKEGKFEELAKLRMRLGGRRAEKLAVALPPLVVREYAHRHVPAANNVRRDFTETVCWQPVLVLPNGKPAEVTFDLSDSVTRYQVQVWAHSPSGRLGATTSEIASRLPFSVEPKVPVEVTRSDKVILPVTVANDSGKSLSVQLGVRAKNLKVVGPADKQLAVDAGKRVRQLFTFRPSVVEGDATVNFVGRSEPLGADRIERAFKIVPEGFPVVGSKSDLLEGVAVHEVVLPKTWVKGTLKLQAQVFPSTLADLQKGLEAMLREPCGCFEQSSSSNYPNVMILSYLKESDQAAPEIEKRARQLMQNGYGRLTSFECIDPQKGTVRRGYEWFGQTAPPHEALTAYGLLQFRDMAKVHPVDAAMMERTRKYLLAQRDGKGGFLRNPRALDSFGRAPQNVTNAYIVWALTEAGNEDNLDLEMKTLRDAAKTSKDPYFVSLVAISHLNRGKTADGLELLQGVAQAQQADGRVTGAQMSITGSGGRDLDIETTALALLGWLRANRPADFNGNVQKAARWVGKQRGGYGGFGSTQSTILALKALIAFTRNSKAIPADSDLVLYVNDKEVARKRFAAGTREEVALQVDESAGLKAGKNVIRVEMKKNNLPHTLTWSYRTLQPVNPANCPVHLSTKLDRNRADEGETVRLTAVVENRSGKGQGMAVAIIGLPGGLIVPEDMKQLKEMARLRDEGTKPGLISAFEIRGRELVLYWRDLAPAQKIEVNLDLICRIPGEYRGPASRSYLYYNADDKFWTEPLAVTVAPRE